MKTISLISGLTALVLGSTATGKTIPNHAVANLVLGQANFVTNALPLPSASSLDEPSAIVIDPVTRKVFVADRDNDRVLRYASAESLANGASAEVVFGQPRFSESDPAVAPNIERGMNQPNGLFLDRKGRLWVADSGNNRVLMFESASFQSIQPFPDRVFGQLDFTENLAATPPTARSMRSPRGVWVDANDRLWVVDASNNRILRFDAISTKPDGAAANGVLGQTLFTTNLSNVGPSSLSSPRSVAVSQTGALFVADRGNSRVLRFDNAATKAPGANADAVLGQVNFNTDTESISATEMNSPNGVAITPDDALWVTDEDNNRIIRFDNASTAFSGAAASGVVGQPDFTTKLRNLTDRGLNDPELNSFVDADGSLWVPDNSNNRVLRFPADETIPLLSVATIVPKTTKKKSLTINGSASDQFGVSLVQFRVGKGPLQNATGTTGWAIKAPLKKGINKITIIATDSVGNVSANKIIKIKRK
jgi:sugar lactone lactonase YvrE